MTDKQLTWEEIETDCWPSKYLAAADLSKAGMTAFVKPIETIMIETLDDEHDREKRRPVIYFSGVGKGLVLNRTNQDFLKNVFRSPGSAIGQPVEVYVTTTLYKGQSTPCLRLRMPAGSQGPPPAGAASEPQGVTQSVPAQGPDQPVPHEHNDSIPF